MPFRSLLMIASSDDSTMAASFACRSSACLRSLMSRAIQVEKLGLLNAGANLDGERGAVFAPMPRLEGNDFPARAVG